MPIEKREANVVKRPLEVEEDDESRRPGNVKEAKKEKVKKAGGGSHRVE